MKLLRQVLKQFISGLAMTGAHHNLEGTNSILEIIER